MRILHEGRLAAKNLLLLVLILSRRRSRKIWNDNFLRNEYLGLYPDVAHSVYPPALHYLIFGNEDLRNPSWRFDARSYLGRYPEVARSGVNALVHFAAFGRREGRFVPGMAAPEPSVVRITNVPWPETEPLVSIVIPCDGRGEPIEGALRSAVDQTFTGIEIIVVEGGPDNSPARTNIREIQASAKPGVRFLYREDREAAGNNRTFGIAAARGRYICCLNADGRLDAKYIEVAVFLAEAFAFGLVYSSIRRFGNAESVWRVNDAAFDQILRSKEIPVPSLFRRGDWRLPRGRRDGGPGEQGAPEDWDLWIQILALGRATRAISEPLLESRMPEPRIRDAVASSPNRLTFKLRWKQLRERYWSLLVPGPEDADQTIVKKPLLNLGTRPGQGRSVLFALPFLTFGGAEALFCMIAGWAQEAGWTPLVITTIDLPPNVPKDPSRFDEVTQRVYPLATLFQSDQERLAFVRYLIQRYRVQVLVLGGSETMYHWLPAIKTDYPDLSVADHLFNGVGHAFNNHQYRGYIDTTVVQSDGVLREIQQQLGDPAGTTRRIPLGVEVPEQAAPPPETGKRDMVIGFFGRLSPEKGPDLFIEIANQLVKSHTGLRFIIAGDGPEKEAVQRMIRSFRLESVLEMPGFVTPVRPRMSQTDIVVLPSRIDGMPASVLEAQALGIPVVASRVGGLPEVIEDCETGYLCPPGAVDLFCDRIGELIHDPELRRRIGSNARRSVEQKHGMEQMKIRYLQLLQDLGHRAATQNNETGPP